MTFKCPFQPKPFYDSMIPRYLSSLLLLLCSSSPNLPKATVCFIRMAGEFLLESLASYNQKVHPGLSPETSFPSSVQTTSSADDLLNVK